MRRNRSVGLDFARPLSCGFGTTGGDGPEGALGCEGAYVGPGIRPVARFGLSPAANCRYRLGHGLGSSARRCFVVCLSSYGRVSASARRRPPLFGLLRAATPRLWPGPPANIRFSACRSRQIALFDLSRPRIDVFRLFVSGQSLVLG
jgi:hypothetical protein